MVMLVWCHPSRSTSRALQQWWTLRVEAPRSRLLKWLTWAGHEALAEEGWTLESNSRRPPSFTAFLPCGIAPPLTACQHPAHLSRSSWTRLSSCWVLFTSLISREGPILFCSIICTRAHAFSQLLVGKICAVSSVLEPEIHSKCWPHFTDEETEKLRQHHWSEGGQLLNRRAGIWMSSCQFRVFCSFTSCCSGGDWRYIWNEDST